jgi:hypothetical protein
MLSCEPGSAELLYQSRIAPLLSDERQASCNECHLSGLDLGSFARDSPCQTMACMQQMGLVNLAVPEQSLVLSWIERADPASELITEEVIAEEYDGMLEWIEYSARCGDQTCQTYDDPCGTQNTYEACGLADGPDSAAMNFEDPGDCSDATLEALFSAKVYSWRGRCYPCHFENDEFEAPEWIGVGPCEVGASKTMRRVLDRGLVDVADPASSLLLLKPLDQEAGGVFHEGHHKIQNTQEPLYVDFLTWLERYSACQP